MNALLLRLVTVAVIFGHAISVAFPAVVGPEIDVCPSFGAAPSNQENVDFAAGNNMYLAVWQDSRGDNGVDIFAARLNPTGQVQDMLGIVISDAAGDQTDPAVAYNGSEYLVVWSDRREANQHIYAARVRPTGEVIDKAGILISASSGSQAYPRVASDGANWLVVWQDAGSSSPDIRGRIVGANGTLSSIYGISTRLDNEETPDVGWNGSNYFVVWCDYRNSATTGADIYGCRVAKNGIRMASDYNISCISSGSTGAANAQISPRICSIGTSCYVVWQDYRNSLTVSDVYGTRVTSGGTIQEKGGRLIGTVANSQEMPAVGFDGNKILVAWRDGTDRLVKGARLDSSGNLLDASGRSISSGMAGAAGIAVNGQSNNFIVGWNILDPTSSDILATVVLDSGTVLMPAGTVIDMSLVNQQDFAVADNGTEYAVVWSQLVNGSYDILGARISRAGTLLTSTPINISTGSYGDQKEPSIAWSGSQYLVVWKGNESLGGENWDIRGICMNSQLNKIGSAFVISTAKESQERPRVFSNRTNYLVVWEDSRNAISPYYYTDLYGALVSTAGAVTKADIAISLATGDQLNPAIASDNTNYFVVWEDWRSGYPLVYGSRVTSAGTAQDSSGIQMPASSYYQTWPSVVYGGGNYFVVWSDWTKITGCRVTTAGSKLDTAGIIIDTASTQKSRPNVCYDTAKYRVVWEDYRSSFANNSDIYYTTVSTAGVVSSDPKMALVTDLLPQYYPCIFSQSAAGMLFYSNYFNYSLCTCAVTLTDQSTQYPGSIASAKTYPTGSLLSLSSKVVTGVYSGYFYMEDPTRLSGIKVVSSVPVGVNDTVDVTGTISGADGERQINAMNVAALGVASNPPKPFAMRGDNVGGSALNQYVPGITGAYGLNNLGLLIKTWGRVTSTASDYFYIEPQPGMSIKVKCGSLTKPSIDQIVVITGISSCEVVSGATGRVVRTRVQSDIQVIQ